MIPSTPEIIAQRYVLQEKIQSGGMASVYRARDFVTDELFAIKRFDLGTHLHEYAEESYRREVEALQNLRHKNILKIVSCGEDTESRKYLVLPLMRCDLIEYRAEGATAFHGWDDFAEQVFLPLVDALAHAHGNGFCHRDIKPANVLISDDAHPCLADFGISKLKKCLESRRTLNEFASRPYSPPELDDGAHGYARDVFSLGVLAVWALATKELLEYEDVYNNFGEFDAPADIRQIIERCLAKDPSERYATASVLQMELTRVQQARVRVFAEKQRPKCVIDFSRAAISAIAAELEMEDENKVRNLLYNDINDEATITRHVKNKRQHDEALVPEHYQVLGGRFSYHVAKHNKKRGFIALGAQPLVPYFLQNLKLDQMSCPITFAPGVDATTLEAAEVINTLELALSEFDAQRKMEATENKTERRFLTWKNLLEAKLKYERDKYPSVPFSSAVAQNGTLTLRIDAKESSLEVGQARVIKRQGRWIAGEVRWIEAGEVTLACDVANLKHLPQKGQLEVDTRAANKAIDRQRAALESLTNAEASTANLRNILASPDSARAPAIPEGEHKRAPGELSELDEWQISALEAALNAPDIFLVQGPPGTGKTAFITNLIAETLRRDPGSRIILTSQTHVAIDNAIERLTASHSDVKVVRIARSDSDSVSASCDKYRVENRLAAWGEEVARNSEAWLEQWSTQHGLSAEEVLLAKVLKQLAVASAERARCEQELDRLKSQKEVSGSDREDRHHAEEHLDPTTIYEREKELKANLSEVKQRVDSLKRRLKERWPDDSKEYLKWSPEELSQWSQELRGQSDKGQLAEDLANLQAAWNDRFGRDITFNAALCERSDVVAGTCIGLASLSGADDVSYDLCIIDEASKATATEALVPMTRAKKWVLVGDTNQLPPFEDAVYHSAQLRKEYELDDADAKETLFQILQRELPSTCVSMLKRQYRMVPPIGRLVSECFYSGELESEKRPLSPSVVKAFGKAVIWYTTQYEPTRNEERAGTSFVNACEVQHILRYLRQLNNALGEGETYDVLLTSGYAAQVQLMQKSVQQEKSLLTRLRIECNTIDAVQGRQADAVLFSVTRSNELQKAGFLDSIERVNVALSRAKELLVLVGDDKFVRHAHNAESLQRVLRHIDANKDECSLEYKIMGQ